TENMVTDLYRCPKCGERKPKAALRWLRGKDEAPTIFVLCPVCLNTYTEVKSGEVNTTIQPDNKLNTSEVNKKDMTDSDTDTDTETDTDMDTDSDTDTESDTKVRINPTQPDNKMNTSEVNKKDMTDSATDTESDTEYDTETDTDTDTDYTESDTDMDTDS